NAPLVAFFFTGALLSVINVMPEFPLLLAERFWPGTGWLQVLLMSLYSAFLTKYFLDANNHRKFRPLIWLGFSLVFFFQLALGLLGFDKFLMTGNLHLPIPALIIAGPLFRGADFFMPILLTTTILLIGPAWCSHLCYIGAWDDYLSRKPAHKTTLPTWTKYCRFFILLGVIAVTFLLRYFSVGSSFALIIACLFGLTGVGIMLFVSRKMGVMAHCLVFCPIGFLTTTFGRLSPFRIKIDSDCKKCQACARVCKYRALNLEQIEKRRSAVDCTLCGDCVSVCPGGHINYHFMHAGPGFARQAFLVLILSLHSIFLAVARI
ncbi:MAG: 4Fe-4S binding protein, partial [Candidatus Rifleibacteriota bacterium]